MANFLEISVLEISARYMYFVSTMSMLHKLPNDVNIPLNVNTKVINSKASPTNYTFQFGACI